MKTTPAQTTTPIRRIPCLPNWQALKSYWKNYQVEPSEAFLGALAAMQNRVGEQQPRPELN